MNILAMDTCFGACSVAVTRLRGAADPVVVQDFERRQTGHAEVLMPMIERVMTDAGLLFKDLTHVAVTTGPGSFTGMRIGIAAARAIGLTLGIPVIGVPTLKVMAHEIVSNQPVLIAVDARKDQVYAQLFDGAGHAVTAPQVLSYCDASRLGGGASIIVCGSGADDVVAACQADGIKAIAMRQDLQPSAASLATIVAALTVTGEHPARPLYLRPPDAKPQVGKSLERVQ
jgi:tRNA threonylcarbamoyladenosine biosynthesis protein TsaB